MGLFGKRKSQPSPDSPVGKLNRFVGQAARLHAEIANGFQGDIYQPEVVDEFLGYARQPALEVWMEDGPGPVRDAIERGSEIVRGTVSKKWLDYHMLAFTKVQVEQVRLRAVATFEARARDILGNSLIEHPSA